MRRPLSTLVAILAWTAALAPTAPPAVPPAPAARRVIRPTPLPLRARARILDRLTAAELEDDLGLPFHGAVGRRGLAPPD